MHRLIAMLAATLLLAACAAQGDQPIGDDDPAPTGPGTHSPGDGDVAQADAILVIEEGATATGPGISVNEALAQAGSDQPLLVNGSLFIDAEGNVLLCEAMAESFPPQCGGGRLLVEGVELTGIPDLVEANGVRWSESAVQLLGRIEPAG